MVYNLLNRYKSLDYNNHFMNFKTIVIGVIIFLVGLFAVIAAPLYYPSYSTINHIYAENENTVTIKPYAQYIVKTIQITPENNSVIFFVINSNANVSIYNVSNLKELGNNQGEIGLQLTPGKYNLVVINNENSSQEIKYTYGIFPSNYINGFYYGLSIYDTVMEIVALAGAAIAIISLLQELLSRRRK